MTHIPKLLCPAGSIESLKAAVNNGADAVYFGGRDFNARAGAQNFSDDELLEAIDYAHLRGAKANITINTLYKGHSPDTDEVYRAMTFARKMYESGADAFIVTDLGLFSLIKEQMPGISLHASTQMTVHSLQGAILLREMGFDRVVLSRELSLAEIKLIVEESGLEIEVFAHGALCVSYSGQCLMSSILGQRSANRGKCAQPCRQHYNFIANGKKRDGGYLLSPRDIMTLGSLKELAESGVDTLKIEGRMKSAEYVAVVTKAYREQLDRVAAGEYDVPKEAQRDVTQIFNRGGESTSGYLFGYSGTHMISVKTPKSTGTYLGTVASVAKSVERTGKLKTHIKIEREVIAGDGVEVWTETSGENAGGYITAAAQAGDIVTVYLNGPVKSGDLVYKSYDKTLSDKAKADAINDTRKIKLSMSAKIKAGQPMEMTLMCGEVSMSVVGSTPELSKNQPLSHTRVLEQLTKLGGTPFEVHPNKAALDMDENMYMPMSALNALRRDCVQAFEKKYIGSFRRNLNAVNVKTAPIAMSEDASSSEYKLCAQTFSEDQLRVACEEGVEKVYFTISGYNNKAPLRIAENYANQTTLYIALPKIMRPFDEVEVEALIKSLEKTAIRGYLVSTYGQLAILCRLTNKKIIADYTFNVLNPLSYHYLAELGADGVTLSPELTMREIEAFPGGEAIAYGRLPLMVTVQCPIGLYGSDKAGKCAAKKDGASVHFLEDKTGAVFPVYTDCESCIAQILNGPKINMQEKLNNFSETNLDWLRLMFYTESSAEIKETLKGFRTGSKPTEPITYGHYFRGAK